MYSVAFVSTEALLIFDAGESPSRSLIDVFESPAAIRNAGTASRRAVIFVLMFVRYFISITLWVERSFFLLADFAFGCESAKSGAMVKSGRPVHDSITNGESCCEEDPASGALEPSGAKSSLLYSPSKRHPGETELLVLATSDGDSDELDREASRASVSSNEYSIGCAANGILL